jgi:hypothetical protein
MESVGAQYIELGDLYLETFPIDLGSYRVKKFDQWGYHLGDDYIRLPKLGEHPGDKGWGTHLQNRHSLKNKVNIGGRCLLRDPETMFQIECDRATWRTVPLIDHTVSLARSLSNRSRKTLATRLKAIYSITDQSEQFPHSTQEAFDRIAYWLGNAQQDYDFAGMKLVQNLNHSFAEIKQQLLVLQADGEDISKLAIILKQAGLELDAPVALPKPKQLTHSKKKKAQ